MAGQRSGSSIIKIAVTASAGAAIEWYDFFIYGTAAALVFPKLFFPADLPPLVAQIAAFSTFAVGFVARPIGGLLFGHFGDLFGRKRALAVALLIMGAATTCVGLLPTYARVGILAPLLLVALRFVQGLAVGGQWGGAALLAIESAPPGRQGFYGSFVQIGVPLGVLLANVVCGRPGGCKKILRMVERVVEVLTCVRPLDAAVHTPPASMEFADRVHIVSARSRRLRHSWFSRPRLIDYCAIPF